MSESTNACLTLILARPPVGSRPELETACEALRKTFGAAGLTCTVVDSPYDLRAKDPGAVFLKGLRQAVVVAWHYPRATRWMLQQRRLGPEREAGVLECLDARGPNVLEEVQQVLSGRQLAPAVAVPLAARLKARWYPVVDGERCRDCRQCLEFCLFGVYVVREKRVQVVRPDQCRSGCPACAKVCPHGAIMFPKYEADVAIAGEASQPAKSTVQNPQQLRDEYLKRAAAGSDPAQLMEDFRKLRL